MVEGQVLFTLDQVLTAQMVDQILTKATYCMARELRMAFMCLKCCKIKQRNKVEYASEPT